MLTKTISIAEGKLCKIDAEVHGMTIEGPAVIVIMNGISAGSSNPTENQYTHSEKSNLGVRTSVSSD